MRRQENKRRAFFYTGRRGGALKHECVDYDFHGINIGLTLSIWYLSDSIVQILRDLSDLTAQLNIAEDMSQDF